MTTSLRTLSSFWSPGECFLAPSARVVAVIHLISPVRTRHVAGAHLCGAYLDPRGCESVHAAFLCLFIPHQLRDDEQHPHPRIPHAGQLPRRAREGAPGTDGRIGTGRELSSAGAKYSREIHFTAALLWANLSPLLRPLGKATPHPLSSAPCSPPTLPVLTYDGAYRT